MSAPSTLKQMALADRLSVPQLQQAVKDGTLPAYIAVPLIQEKMKEEKQAAMMAAASQPQQPPVASQVMSQADQQQAIAGLPTDMPQGYAPGGIVAFDDGGDVDADEYNEAREEAELNEFMAAIEGRGAKPAAPALAVNKTPATGLGYGDVQGARLKADRSQSTTKYDASGHKYDALATEHAEKIGLNPALARYMLNKETGGLKNPESAISRAGAMGPSQLMPATARELGVDPRDPEQNVRGGLNYLKKMMDKYGDERLALAAYNAGPGRVDRALRSGQGIASLPGETQKYIGMAKGGIAAFAGEDESLVADDLSGAESLGDNMYDYKGVKYKIDPESGSYLVGGVKTSPSLIRQSAASPWNTERQPAPKSSVPEEPGVFTKAGSAAMDVLSAPYNGAVRGVNGLFGTNIPVPASGTPWYDKYVRGNENAFSSTAAPSVASTPVPAETAPQTNNGVTFPGANAALVRRTDNAIAKRNPEAIRPQIRTKEEDEGVKKAVEAAEKAPDKASYWDELIDDIRTSRKGRQKQKDQDFNMSLLSAGLGMMAGTSPYAAANIGQGAMHGVNQYAQLRKQAAAEEAADIKNLANIGRYQSLDEFYKQKAATAGEDKTAALEQKKVDQAAQARDRFFQRERETILSMFPKDPTMWDDATRQRYQDLVNKIYTNPRYIAFDRVADPSSYAGFKVVK